MMSMRTGFKRLTGSQRRRRSERGNAFLYWMIILIFAIILVWMLIR